MIARLALTRTRRAFSAAEFAALESAGIFAGYPAAAWSAGEVYRADDGSPYLFSVEQYHRTIERAILGKYDRVELIAGEVLHKMSIGERHSGCVKRLNRLFNRRCGSSTLVGIQDPIVLADSEPEPDGTLLLPRADDYTTAKPRPAEVLLLVEVADSSLADDLGVKAALYAENDIAEYWVVDLVHDRVHVHRGPQPDGSWATVAELSRGDALTVAALPGVAFAVDELLP